MERTKPTRTKAQVRADALARGQEARYSGKKKQWYFHKSVCLKNK